MENAKHIVKRLFEEPRLTAEALAERIGQPLPTDDD